MKMQKESGNVLLGQQIPNVASKTNQISRQTRSRASRVRALRRNRGTGVIYDVIDGWLAPLFARVIAQQLRTRSGPSPR